MIPALGPIAVNGIAFAALASVVLLAAWSGRPARLLAALAAASALMLASWLKPVDVAGLALFLLPPYLVIRHLWGRGGGIRGWAVAVMAWQVALFVVLRRYEPLDRWIDHPVAVIGLSYMLFRILHLAVEAPTMGRLRLDPVRYLTYVTAFWTLLAGPIQRYDDFLDQIGRAARPDPAAMLGAGHRMVNGLLKAFVAAPLFLAVSSLDLLAAPGAGWLDGAVVFLAYPAYLYLNFSGYTDVVVGLAALCGVRLPENFDNPYLSRNIQEFWGRWHMSFGVWIRHYVFTPLCKELLTRARGRHAGPLTALAVLVTFVAVGLWHGTTPGFLVFGIAHGLAIVACGLWGGLLKAWLGKAGRKQFLARPATRWASTALTFAFVCLTMQVFANPVGKVVAAWSSFLAARLA